MVLLQYQAQMDANKSENEAVTARSFTTKLYSLWKIWFKECVVVYEMYVRTWQEQRVFPYSTAKNNDGHKSF